MALQQSDIGSAIQLNVFENSLPFDLTGAVTTTIAFKKPSLTVISRDGDFSEAPEEGLVEYVFVSGDLNEDGVWQAQVIIDIDSGTYHSEIFIFTVGEALA